MFPRISLRTVRRMTIGVSTKFSYIRSVRLNSHLEYVYSSSQVYDFASCIFCITDAYVCVDLCVRPPSIRVGFLSNLAISSVFLVVYLTLSQNSARYEFYANLICVRLRMFITCKEIPGRALSVFSQDRQARTVSSPTWFCISSSFVFSLSFYRSSLFPFLAQLYFIEDQSILDG